MRTTLWLGLLGAVLVTAPPARAQVVAPTGITFESADHTGPLVERYQAYLYRDEDLISTAKPLQVGTPVLKDVATSVDPTTPLDYRLTFAAMGLQLPPCVTAPCPVYKAVIAPSGPGGTSQVGPASESLPFVAGPPPPAPTTNLRPN